MTTGIPPEASRGPTLKRRQPHTQSRHEAALWINHNCFHYSADPTILGCVFRAPPTTHPPGVPPDDVAARILTVLGAFGNGASGRKKTRKWAGVFALHSP